MRIAKRTGVVLLSIAAACVMNEAADASVVGYWPFDEGTGSTIHDSSGNAFDASIINLRSDTWAEGKRGGAMYVPHVDGWASTRAEIGDGGRLEPTNAISFSAWLWTYDAYEDQAVIAKEGPSNLQYWFGVSRYGYGMLLDRNGLSPWDGDDRNQSYPASGNWIHVASTWDGSTIRHYLNGVLDPATLPFTGSLFNGPDVLTIGANSDYMTTAFEGRIDELYLFDHALSQIEVTRLYELNYAVPEPVSLGVLAFGSAHLLRRTRR